MLKRLGSLAVVAAVAAVCVSCAGKSPEFANEKQISIIPLPVSVKRAMGKFEINKKTVIHTADDQDSMHCAKYFQAAFANASGMELAVKSGAPETMKNIIVIVANNKLAMEKEAYKIKVTPKAAVLTAKEGQGLFWGVQSLLQLLPTAADRAANLNQGVDWEIPACVIQDKPRFSYRGMHLDVGRHLFPVASIKKYIDYLAAHKINTFHWHLTEDQGWRIEIKKYPKLTSVGAWRGPADNCYGGFYTQEEVKDIVKYATDRYITVIPEIEMPGHSVAAVSAYPELSCRGEKVPVRTAWGVSQDVYCAGNEEVFTFIQDVLTEVMELFPSEYIHIGGDECPKKRWKQCPKCQGRISDEGLKNEYELQSWFIRRIEKFLNSKGRNLIGWDEIMEGGLSPNATVMFWLHMNNVKRAAAEGHNIIMTPNHPFYFDHYQGDRSVEPKAIGGFAPLQKVYEYEIVPKGLTEKEAKHIIGGQANCWTEYMPKFSKVEYMVLPRMAALAENLWTPVARRNYAHFTKRMRSQYQRYAFMGANFRIPAPQGPAAFNGFVEEAEVLFEKPAYGVIRYTTDGSEPTAKSSIYKKTFTVDEDTIVKAKIYTAEGASSVTSVSEFKKVTYLEPVEADVKPGVAYKLYKGTFHKTAGIKGDAVRTGEVKGLTLPADATGDFFGLELEGYIKIDKPGVYRFYTASDDGSCLYVGDQKVVDNDGLHSTVEKSGMVALNSGLHPIKVAYIEATGAETLKVMISGNGMKKQIVPAGMLFQNK